MPLDIKLFFFLNGFAGKSQFADALIIFFASYLAYILPLVFLFFVWRYHVSARERALVIWNTALITVLSRGLITESIRALYARPRPFVTHQVVQLIPESGPSFPSGHAAFFFALAAAIFYYDRKWGAWFFVAAGIISIARVISGVHWPTDIAGGFAVAVISAVLVFYLTIRKRKDPVA